MGCNISIHAPYSPLKSAAKVTPVPEKRESLTNSLSTKNSADKTLNQLFLEKQSNELSPDRRTYLSKASEEISQYPEGREDNRPCDVFWHNVVYSDMKNLVRSANSKVNKFPGMTELAKKISLTHAISSMQHLFPTEYSFYPKSWFLPAHFSDFQKFCKNKVEQQQKQGVKIDMWFIVKPDEGAQGNGIYLISNPDQIQNPHQKQLVQEYIADPFLMSDHLKFDFRVYGLIKSINPLSIYVAREGMARFCTEKYSKPDASNFENLYAHLTNYSLNKGNESYVHSYSLEDQSKGSKRLLSTVFHQLESRGLKTKKLWHEIKMILIKTVLAMLPEIMLHYEHHFYDLNGPQCFQIMGFDIMISSDGTPILLEVNAAPSMTIGERLYIIFYTTMTFSTKWTYFCGLHARLKILSIL
uniref:Tubulin--tyrosine ligase-like protein 9 n=1 Tax=Heterorhabditis bacteriophora TaxID=37862 RepID=A0A1I7XV01_HETBA